MSWGFNAAPLEGNKRVASAATDAFTVDVATVGARLRQHHGGVRWEF